MRLIISDHERAALAEVTQFPLFAAITGRRSRRFPVGARIPAGALAYTSRRPVQPLSEVERALLLSVTGRGHWLALRHYIPPRLRAVAAQLLGQTSRIRQYRIRRVTSTSRRFHLMNQSTLLRQLPPLRPDRSGVITGAIRLL